MEVQTTQQLSSCLTPGTLLADRYRITAALGIGSTATVYSAVDTYHENFSVAVKVLHPKLAANAAYVARFWREVKLLCTVTHPNIIRVFDIYADDGHVFYSMELLETATLKDTIDQRKFDVFSTAHIAAELCRGLRAIHEKGIVHRDVKPGNVLLAEGYRVVLADFGAARGEASTITRTGETVGSVCYIAPEAWDNTTPSPAGDYYSLGVVLYELTTQRLPFVGNSPYAVLHSQLKGDAPRPRALNRAIPRWLDALIVELLERDPERRLSSPEQILERIESGLKRSTTWSAGRVLNLLRL
ncbi:MAG: serine/threonine protein kinase [Bdellovibrionales bacterium]|nr:serine/threonine protein kinase [Bdellovibrionales bacterium]